MLEDRCEVRRALVEAHREQIQDLLELVADCLTRLPRAFDGPRRARDALILTRRLREMDAIHGRTIDIASKSPIDLPKWSRKHGIDST